MIQAVTRKWLEVKPEAIPAELKACRQWVGWKCTRGKDGRITKVPYNANVRDRWGSSTNPDTWGDFGAAERRYREDGLDGVGFCPTDTDDYCAIDLDNAVNPETGEPSEAAQRIIDRIDSYTEISPSGNGYRIFARGKDLPYIHKNNGHGIEIYNRKKYLTVTGWHVPGTPTTVEERSPEILDQCHETFGEYPEEDCKPDAVELSRERRELDCVDEELLLAAYRAEGGEKLRALMNGDCSEFDGDQSKADAALIARLGWWTRYDPDWTDRLFRSSKLMRKKWDSPRGGVT